MPLDPVSSGDPHVPAHNAERDAINTLEAGLATKISLPPGAATGDLLRWDGTQWLTTETRFFEGSGPPNGVVAAPVGSRYVDKVATNGIVEWVKNSGGTGNTGWITQYGVAGGSASLTSGAADALKGPTAVSFPVGRFSVAPAVAYSTSNSFIYGVWISGITSTGFNVYYKSSVANTAFTFNWVAAIKG